MLHQRNRLRKILFVNIKKFRYDFHEMEKINILIAAAESSERKLIGAWLESEGCRVETAADAKEILKKSEQKRFDILVAVPAPVFETSDSAHRCGRDIGECLDRIREKDPDTAVVVIASECKSQVFKQIKNKEAPPCLFKPRDACSLKMQIRKIIENQCREREYLLLKERDKERTRCENIRSGSETKHSERIRNIALMNSVVLIAGERGTGKKSAAKAVHDLSPRSRGPFVSVNFSLMPDNLMERKLFGCQKGAFEDAGENEKGLLELARGGTLFLDEVGDAPGRIQTELAAVLKKGFFCRIGGIQRIEADFRLTASTCKNLEIEVMKRKFREDFFIHLNAVCFEMPLLRECKEDIPLFAEHFVRRFAREMSLPVPRISDEAMNLLTEYPWPGNLRELANAVERAVMVSAEGKILPEDLPVRIPEVKNYSLKEIEKNHIVRVLDTQRWNIAKSAKLLEIDRSTLYNKIKQYDLVKKPYAE